MNIVNMVLLPVKKIDITGKNIIKKYLFTLYQKSPV